MTAYVALVRAVNVAGTGKLPKEDLRAIGEECGFSQVRTFINSGNLLFVSDLSEDGARRTVEDGLAAYLARPTRVHVRNAAEMARAVRDNPFTDEKASRVLAHFIDADPVQSMLDDVRGQKDERLALGPRLIYVSYGEGMGRSRLSIPAASEGTARNMNSVARIADLLADMK